MLHVPVIGMVVMFISFGVTFPDRIFGHENPSLTSILPPVLILYNERRLVGGDDVLWVCPERSL